MTIRWAVFAFLGYMAFAAVGVFGGQWMGQMIAGTMQQTWWSVGTMLGGLAVMSVVWVLVLAALDDV